MNHIYAEHLQRVVVAMRATGDNRGPTLVGIIRRGMIEQWPESWLVGALSQHISIEQAEELSHQERVYYDQAQLIDEQLSVAERLGLCAFKEWRTQPTACTECVKLTGVRVPIDSNFPTHLIRISGIWIDTYFVYAHSFCECQPAFSFKR